MNQENSEQRPTEAQAEPLSRRGMLRYGAFAAAAAAGAGGTAALASPAQAAPGDPVTVDGTATGAATTKLSGSSLEVAASNATSVATVQKAAVVGRATATQAAGVVGVGAGTQGAGVVAINPSGPQLQLNVLDFGTFAFPPATGRYEAGAILNVNGAVFQCVWSDNAPDSNTLWRGLSGLPNPSLHLLPKPVRVYSSSNDPTTNSAKARSGETRRIGVLTARAGGGSGVPFFASAVLGSIQIHSTEADGYIAIAAGDVNPSGFSTTVWTGPNMASVTSFTSALADPDNESLQGTLSVMCAGKTTARAHYFIDIVGYYEDDLWPGGPAAAATPSKDMSKLTKSHGALERRFKAMTKR